MRDPSPAPTALESDLDDDEQMQAYLSDVYASGSHDHKHQGVTKGIKAAKEQVRAVVKAKNTKVNTLSAGAYKSSAGGTLSS